MDIERIREKDPRLSEKRFVPRSVIEMEAHNNRPVIVGEHWTEKLEGGRLLIRRFKKKDLESIMKIWLESNIQAHSFINEQYWKDNYKTVKEMMPDATLFVYEESGKIKAFSGLIDNYIAGIFVVPDSQAQGIGRSLLQLMKEKYTELSLRVYQKNNRAVEFYRREEFILSAEEIDENTGELELVMAWRKDGKV